MMDEQNKDAIEDVGGQLKKGGKALANNPAANKAKQGMKKVAKEGLKKVGKLLGKLAIKAVVGAIKLLISFLVAFGPVILVVLGVVATIAGGFYIFQEVRGTEQIYDYDKASENVTEMDDDGIRRTNSSLESSNTKAIKDYYIYMEKNSYHKLLEGEDEFLEGDEKDEVEDYYQKEKQFLLNRDLLYTMDYHLHQGLFIYPEQFIQPVHADLEEFTLLPLTTTSEDGSTSFINVESRKYNEDDRTLDDDETETSIADYGLGSIFEYKEEEEQQYVKGTVYKKDVWDEATETKRTIDVDEPFKEMMPGYPKKIHVINRGVTIEGGFELKYEREETAIRDLIDYAENGDYEANTMAVKIKIGEGIKHKTVVVQEEIVDEDGTVIQEEITKEVEVGRVPLYAYRKGALYKNLPVETDMIQLNNVPEEGEEVTEENEDEFDTFVGEQYLRDYMFDYHIHYPVNVLDDFNLEDRGVEYGDFGGLEFANFEVGQSTNPSSGNFKKYEQALTYQSYAVQYGQKYGIDPNVLIAIMAQESGGIADVNDKGLMQIIALNGNWERTIRAKNASGGPEKLTIYKEDRKNPDKAIEYASMMLKNSLDAYDGDILKAVLSYNMGQGTVNWIRDNYPDDWETDQWLTHIPEANSVVLNNKGHNEYLQAVFQYYSGETGLVEAEEGWFKKVGNAIGKAFKFITFQDYSETEEFIEYEHQITPRQQQDIVDLSVALNTYTLFSKVGLSEEGIDILSRPQMGSDFGGSISGNYYRANAIRRPTDIKVNDYIKPFSGSIGRITSPTGYRYHPVNGVYRFHKGVDIAMPEGTRLYASARGTLYNKTDSGDVTKGYGYYVYIYHDNGTKSLYAHMSKNNVVPDGTIVEQGQYIGDSGNTGTSTGPHLHYEIITRQGESLDTAPLFMGERHKTFEKILR